MRRLPLRSPLRMRGKGPDDRAHPLVPGITPAYAGKSTKQAKQQDKARDHPRVCGEKSPQRTLNHRQGGITPAYAGKS